MVLKNNGDKDIFRTKFFIFSSIFFVSFITFFSIFITASYAQGSSITPTQVVSPVVSVTLAPTGSPPISPESTSLPTVEPTKAAANIATNQITGYVVNNDGNTLTIKTDTETLRIIINEDVLVKRNGLATDISAIQANDKVVITRVGETVVSVDATAGNVFAYDKWAIPLAILSMVVLLILWRLIVYSRKSHTDA